MDEDGRGRGLGSDALPVVGDPAHRGFELALEIVRDDVVHEARLEQGARRRGQLVADEHGGLAHAGPLERLGDSTIGAGDIVDRRGRTLRLDISRDLLERVLRHIVRRDPLVNPQMRKCRAQDATKAHLAFLLAAKGHAHHQQNAAALLRQRLADELGDDAAGGVLVVADLGAAPGARQIRGQADRRDVQGNELADRAIVGGVLACHQDDPVRHRTLLLDLAGEDMRLG